MAYLPQLTLQDLFVTEHYKFGVTLEYLKEYKQYKIEELEDVVIDTIIDNSFSVEELPFYTENIKYIFEALNKKFPNLNLISLNVHCSYPHKHYTLANSYQNISIFQ